MTIVAPPHKMPQQFWQLRNLTILPLQEIVDEMSKFRLVTLEVMEDRTRSTVYRIRETGKVYQQWDDGQVTVYPDYDTYLWNSKPNDEEIQSFAHKPPVYVVQGDKVKRVKYPRFVASYSPQCDISELEWIDAEPKPITAAAKIKNAVQFLKTHIHRQP